jgi:hypothetical protein
LEEATLEEWGGWRQENGGAVALFGPGLFQLESIELFCDWAGFDGHIDLFDCFVPIKNVEDHEFLESLRS